MASGVRVPQRMKVPLSASERQRGWVLGQSAKEIWAQPNCPRPFPQQGFLLSQPVYLSLDSAALIEVGIVRFELRRYSSARHRVVSILHVTMCPCDKAFRIIRMLCRCKVPLSRGMSAKNSQSEAKHHGSGGSKQAFG